MIAFVASSILIKPLEIARMDSSVLLDTPHFKRLLDVYILAVDSLITICSAISLLDSPQAINLIACDSLSVNCG